MVPCSVTGFPVRGGGGVSKDLCAGVSPLDRDLHHPDRNLHPLKWAMRILLECILVDACFQFMMTLTYAED